MSEIFQIASLSTAIIRMIVHAFTGTAAVASYLTYAYPCLFSSSCSNSGENSSDLILALVGTYFLYDISSLPQDVFYILANTLGGFDPKSAII